MTPYHHLLLSISSCSLPTFTADDNTPIAPLDLVSACSTPGSLTNAKPVLVSCCPPSLGGDQTPFLSAPPFFTTSLSSLMCVFGTRPCHLSSPSLHTTPCVIRHPTPMHLLAHGGSGLHINRTNTPLINKATLSHTKSVMGLHSLLTKGGDGSVLADGTGHTIQTMTNRFMIINPRLHGSLHIMFVF